MLQKEFEAMTDFKATVAEYEKIEQQYYEFDGDKDKFCQDWKENKMMEVVNDRQKRIEMLEEMVDGITKINTELREKLNRAENWKPSDCGTRMRQEKYMELKNAGEEMEPQEAVDKLAAEFGFDRSRIKIITDVETFERNSIGMIRVADRYTREPIYNATDWNYVRFDCAGQQWEMVNGELREYEN